MLVRLLSVLARGLLHLRYRIQLDGIKRIVAQGRGGILFLPNHPALIDPFIIWSELSRHFRVSALADKDQMNRPILRWIVPRVGRALWQGCLAILVNGILFDPRRPVSIELTEPADLPHNAKHGTLNRYLEAFYNREVQSNTYVPYTIWERGGARPMPEPASLAVEASGETIPPATAEIVLKHLRELSGKQDMRRAETLAGDLGLDSLARVWWKPSRPWVQARRITAH